MALPTAVYTAIKHSTGGCDQNPTKMLIYLNYNVGDSRGCQ